MGESFGGGNQKSKGEEYARGRYMLQSLGLQVGCLTACTRTKGLPCIHHRLIGPWCFVLAAACVHILLQASCSLNKPPPPNFSFQIVWNLGQAVQAQGSTHCILAELLCCVPGSTLPLLRFVGIPRNHECHIQKDFIV